MPKKSEPRSRSKTYAHHRDAKSSEFISEASASRRKPENVVREQLPKSGRDTNRGKNKLRCYSCGRCEDLDLKTLIRLFGPDFPAPDVAKKAQCVYCRQQTIETRQAWSNRIKEG